MSLRNAIYGALSADAELTTLGIVAANVYPNFAPDDPRTLHARWLVIRWGVADRPPGRDTTARTVAMSLWAYDRERDWAGIDAILKRSRVILDGLAGLRFTGGAVLEVSWQFSSEDLVDEGYD